MGHAEPGTEANPIVIRDEPALLSSSSDPLVTYVDEGWCHAERDSNADTEIMTTPEF